MVRAVGLLWRPEGAPLHASRLFRRRGRDSAKRARKPLPTRLYTHVCALAEALRVALDEVKDAPAEGADADADLALDA